MKKLRMVAGASALGLFLMTAPVGTANAAVVTKSAKGNCYAGQADQNSVTVVWEIDTTNKRARAVQTRWGGVFALDASRVVTDQAKGGSLVSGGRKQWYGGPATNGSYRYVMPWSSYTGSRLDVNVGIWEGSVTGSPDCTVRIRVPA